MYIAVHVKYMLLFSDLLKREYSWQIVQKILILNFMKIHRWGAELFYIQRETGERTDMTKLKIAFSNYTNAPNIQTFNAV
jgi:hypothetical protein